MINVIDDDYWKTLCTFKLYRFVLIDGDKLYTVRMSDRIEIRRKSEKWGLSEVMAIFWREK